MYAYQVQGFHPSRRDRFLGRAVDDPGLIKPYTTDAQSGHFSSDDFAAFAFYTARSALNGLRHRPSSMRLKTPTEETRLGGNTTIMAAK